MRKKLKSILCLILIALLTLSGCTFPLPGFFDRKPAETPEPAATEEPEPTFEPTPVPVRYESGMGKARISEVMSKNKATVQDRDGDFPDWIELENICGEDLSLEGWTLSKNGGKSEWVFPPFTLYAGSRAVVFASKKDRADEELHASFSFSVGDTLALCDRNGDAVSSCMVSEEKADYSFIQEESGEWTLCAWPTPGKENSALGYEFFMNERKAAGPLAINEVCVENYTSYYDEVLEYSDWVEIKNISDTAVNLSGYQMTDNLSEPGKYTLEGTLNPGEVKVILCDKNAAAYTGSRPIAPFSLDSEIDQLYLIGPAGEILDFCALREIPNRGTYGRVPGRDGFFYLYAESPSGENGEGERRVAAMPEAVGGDGVFNGVQDVTVTLEANGDIYYTLDCSVPTTASTRYTGPFTLTETTVVRAICVEDQALTSRVRTLNYIINEGHTLPVACLVADDQWRFRNIYDNGYKGIEIPGNLSFYEEDGSFSIGCSMKMHGFSSLNLPKKNLSLRFRGSYGAERLEYDLFDGGVASFRNLVLRAGQDQNNTIVRNEVCYSIAEEFSDKVFTERFKYCVMYLNGKYNGIYAIMEKPNEDMVATKLGIKKDDVEMFEAPSYSGDFYDEIVSFCFTHDLREQENYEHIAQLLDIDSLIDWSLLQAFFGNYDLASGNLRYVRDVNGGKWKLVLYDLDICFLHPVYCMNNVFRFESQIAELNIQLVRNEEFRDKLLRRAAEAFSSVLTVEHALERIDEFCEVVAPETERDSKLTYMSPESWRNHVNDMKNLILDNDWINTNLQVLYEVCYMSAEERELYFGDLLK